MDFLANVQRQTVYALGTDHLLLRRRDVTGAEQDLIVHPFFARERLETLSRSYFETRDLLAAFRHIANFTHALGFADGSSSFTSQVVVPELMRRLEAGEWCLLERKLLAGGAKTKRDGGDGPKSSKIEPTPPIEATLGTFTVRWVDEMGEPIGKLMVQLSEEMKNGTFSTDASGTAQLKDCTGSFATARVTADALRDALKDRWNQARGKSSFVPNANDTVVEFTEALSSVNLIVNEPRTIVVRPSVARSRLIGGFFDLSKTFLLPSAIEAMRSVVRMHNGTSRGAVLIVGHTDTTGKDAFNETLSLERAEATRDFLTDQVDAWLRWYGNDIPRDKRWGGIEDSLMIQALPDAGSRRRDESLVGFYQRTRSLNGNGTADEATRKSLITEYMGLRGTSLPKNTPITVHGAGESFPREDLDAPRQGEVREEDRRVEVFFFDRTLGVQPVAPGRVSKKGSKEYPEWSLRAKRNEDHELLTQPFELQIHDELYRPCVDTPYQIVLPSRVVLEGQTDSKGWIRSAVPRGRQVIRIKYTPRGETTELVMQLVMTDAPLSSDEALLAHLRNLGFTHDDGTDRGTVLRFQATKALPRTGKLDSATRNAIVAIVQGITEE